MSDSSPVRCPLTAFLEDSGFGSGDGRAGVSRANTGVLSLAVYPSAAGGKGREAARRGLILILPGRDRRERPAGGKHGRGAVAADRRFRPSANNAERDQKRKRAAPSVAQFIVCSFRRLF